ncbi:MAG: hypothetical protein E4H20_03630 [Spirochaetales bacterium]|nr:MAG: hypothetical protein E4H20_03630 [Spirochaetales bacterium]
MGSDPGSLGALAVLGVGASFFFVVALVLSIRRFMRRNRQDGRSGLSLVFLSLSVAVACASWGIVLLARGRSDWEALTWYLAGGGLAGLAVAIFPRAAGVPLVVLAALAWIGAATEVTAWHPWVEGRTVAKLSVYSVETDYMLCGLSLPDRNTLPIVQNVRLPPGDLGLSVQTLRFRGPLAFLVGERYYRLSAILAGDQAHPLPFERGPLVSVDGRIALVARLLGAQIATASSDRFPAEEFAVVSLMIRPDGSIGLARE